jgi:hypothetical protein
MVGVWSIGVLALVEQLFEFNGVVGNMHLIRHVFNNW